MVASPFEDNVRNGRFFLLLTYEVFASARGQSGKREAGRSRGGSLACGFVAAPYPLLYGGLIIQFDLLI